MKITLLFLLTLLLCGCSAQAEEISEPTIPSTSIVETLSVEEEALALALPPDPASPVVLECTAPGLDAAVSDWAVVDWSNAADGYIMVRFTAETAKRLKLRLIRQTTYTYNLEPQEWTVFPLSDGDGDYQVILYQNTSGNQYAKLMSTSFHVDLEDEFVPFLRPNQYVNYACSPDTLALGQRLCTGITAPLEKVAAVYDYVVTNLSYDYDKAATVKSGYLPDLDQVLAAKKGICFDYAALMTAILRSQQVPCKLVVGYAGSTYHAWISVWTQENGWIDGVIFFDGQTWKRMDPTFASSQNQSPEILDFIENGTYTAKYLY